MKDFEKFVDSLSEILIKALKELEKNNKPLDKNTLKNCLQDNESVINLLSVEEYKKCNEHLKSYILDKIKHLKNFQKNEELDKIEKELIQASEHCEIVDKAIDFISVNIADYETVSFLFSKIKLILEKVIDRITHISHHFFDLLDESIDLMTFDTSVDKTILAELNNIASLTDNKDEIDNILQKITGDLDNLIGKIEEKLHKKDITLEKIRMDKSNLDSEFDEYKNHANELDKLKAELNKFKAETITDFLTGLYNKKYLDNKLGEYFDLYKRYGKIFSVIFLDIDDFKYINDTYGHLVGDYVLKYFSDIIKKNLRNVDYAFRFGGEEFVILLPETSKSEAYHVAERIRQNVSKTTFKYRHYKIKITVSMGVAEVDSYEQNPENILDSVDKKLIKAKQTGKNRIVSD